ncbi:two-component response regulator [Gloeobacter violaceus PCC 7421]|uniref:Two-component response regulator n=2 Tax=Gloeobacter violaceus TaxID=33072 RepID=Q7NKE6_GLOVI|nr:two-component response regulator [Gloeobacter violaceus PCC 7421]
MRMEARARNVVLVVEDNSIDSLMIERTFCKAAADSECHWVSSAEEAMRYLEGAGHYADRENFPLPRIVVTDLRLPGSSGLELLAWIQKRPELKDLPVLVLTGTGNRELERAYQMGAYFYLLKPLATETLVEVLSSFQTA